MRKKLLELSKMMFIAMVGLNLSNSQVIAQANIKQNPWLAIASTGVDKEKFNVRYEGDKYLLYYNNDKLFEGSEGVGCEQPMLVKNYWTGINGREVEDLDSASDSCWPHDVNRDTEEDYCCVYLDKKNIFTNFSYQTFFRKMYGSVKDEKQTRNLYRYGCSSSLNNKNKEEITQLQLDESGWTFLQPEVLVHKCYAFEKEGTDNYYISIKGKVFNLDASYTNNEIPTTTALNAYQKHKLYTSLDRKMRWGKFENNFYVKYVKNLNLYLLYYKNQEKGRASKGMGCKYINNYTQIQCLAVNDDGCGDAIYNLKTGGAIQGWTPVIGCKYENSVYKDILQGLDFTITLTDSGQAAMEYIIDAANGMFNSYDNFCWRKNQPTGGVGIVADSCPAGKWKCGALCCNECKAGYEWKAGVCYQKCKEGHRDNGALCAAGGSGCDT